ncbi:hypothetical protein V1478_006898, partial [Vespula squamosa]
YTKHVSRVPADSRVLYYQALFLSLSYTYQGAATATAAAAAATTSENEATVATGYSNTCPFNAIPSEVQYVKLSLIIRAVIGESLDITKRQDVLRREYVSGF